MKTGDSETEDTGTPKESGTPSNGGENVVRFPREWIGPLEDLVPIRPATPADPHPTNAVDDELPATADAFWSEDAGVLHTPVQAPVDRSGDIEAANGDVRRAEEAGRRMRIGRLRSRFGRVHRRQLGVAAVAVPLVAMAVIGTLWGSVPGGSSPSAGHHSPASTATIGDALGKISRHKMVTANAAGTHRSSSASESSRAHARHTHVHARVRHAGSVTTTRQGGARQTSHSSTGGSSSAEQVSVTPVRSTSPSVSSPSPAIGAETPVTPTTSPTASSAGAGSGTSASSSGASAFGPSGALGPGSSPNS